MDQSCYTFLKLVELTVSASRGAPQSSLQSQEQSPRSPRTSVLGGRPCTCASLSQLSLPVNIHIYFKMQCHTSYFRPLLEWMVRSMAEFSCRTGLMAGECFWPKLKASLARASRTTSSFPALLSENNVLRRRSSHRRSPLFRSVNRFHHKKLQRDQRRKSSRDLVASTTSASAVRREKGAPTFKQVLL